MIEKSTYQLTEAQRIAHIGSWEHDVGKNESIWSDETYRIFGFVPDNKSVTFAALLDCIHPEDRELLKLKYNQSVTDGIPYDLVHRIVRKSDHEVRYVCAQCIHIQNEEGLVVKSLGTVQDITELVLKENTLKEYANHVVKMVENEQTRIARELHDDLGQTLTLLSFAIKQLKHNNPNHDKLQYIALDMQKNADQMMESIQRICTTLRPPSWRNLDYAQHWNCWLGISRNPVVSPVALSLPVMILTAATLRT